MTEYWNSRAERYITENMEATRFIVTELYGAMTIRNMDDMLFDAFTLGMKELRARAEQSHDEGMIQ